MSQSKIGESGAEDKPQHERWERCNLWWEDEFAYFDCTSKTSFGCLCVYAPRQTCACVNSFMKPFWYCTPVLRGGLVVIACLSVGGRGGLARLEVARKRLTGDSLSIGFDPYTPLDLCAIAVERSLKLTDKRIVVVVVGSSPGGRPTARVLGLMGLASMIASYLADQSSRVTLPPLAWDPLRAASVFCTQKWWPVLQFQRGNREKSAQIQ